jgi:hypothetical protein
MKTLRFSILLAAIAAGITPSQAKLKVHEWGTFTVLQAPDGSILKWYLGQNEATPLPKFVTDSPGGNGFRVVGKTSTALWGTNYLYSIRMETPVLYFYPDAPMEVKVAVEFPGGVITESYPHAFREPARAAASVAAPAEAKNLREQLRKGLLERVRLESQDLNPEQTAVSWQGSLLPVNAENLKTVPDASGPLGRHYAAAREVPDAWLFRRIVPPAAPAAPVVSATPLPAEDGGLLPPPALAKQAPVSAPAVETDHFIFYRGAGNNVSRMIEVTTGDDRSFTLRNRTKDAVPVLFLLHVADGKSAWKRVDDLLPYKMSGFSDGFPEDGFKTVGQQQITLPEATEPLASSTPGLKAEMLAALEKEGLTKAEAAAMVATWDNLWFEERGTRALAVLPQPWVDEVLPIQITPKPEAIERVFVARLELISVAQQNLLVDLLGKTGDDPAGAREQLKKLELGRFARGFLDRAVAVKTREMTAQMHQRFFELNSPPPPAKPAPVVGKTP